MSLEISFLPFDCPICDHKSTFETLRECILANDIYSVMRCSNPKCCGVVFLHYDRREKRIIKVYPENVPKCDERIPEKIRNDFLEAKGCLGTEAYKGTITMCRRAIQNTAIEKGAKKKDLFGQLNELVSKGIIPTSLEKLSHKIRSMGNYGAHPDKDGLDEVKEKDAKEILEFLEHFLTYVFVMPKRVEELESKPEEEEEV